MKNQRNYTNVIQEIEVLSGFKIAIEPIESNELSRLLSSYYRRDDKQTAAPHLTDRTRIGSGQGFLMDLIGQAFDEYASDIHFESYEDRCRVRLRIDGKLIEKYVLDRGNYVSLVNQIKIMSSLDISERRLPQDGRIFISQSRPEV